MEDKFWEKIEIPFQEEDLDFEFANHLTVQRSLLKQAGLAATVAQIVEDLEEEVAHLERQKAEKEQDMAVLRRTILVSNYSKISKSASSTILEAFIWKMAEDSNRINELQTLDKEITLLSRAIAARLPKLNKYKNRLKVLDKTSDRATHYLNHERALMRVNENGNRC